MRWGLQKGFPEIQKLAEDIAISYTTSINSKNLQVYFRKKVKEEVIFVLSKEHILFQEV